MISWQEEYNKKLISSEDAGNLVKSGDQVCFTMGREGLEVGMAIASRLGDLHNVKVMVPSPGYDFGWYDEGWQDSFKITVAMITEMCQEAVDKGLCEIQAPSFIPMSEPVLERVDVLVTEVSPPDEHGFCSFGSSLWAKKKEVRHAELVIAEVNDNLIRTYGDNFIHISEIDYFVKHVSKGGIPGTGSLAGRETKEPEPYLKNICGYVSELIKDGDTLQIGVGRTTEPLVKLGLLNGKHDLGWHSEATPPGIITLVKEGVINGRLKTINTGKVVVTSIGGSTREEMQWVNGNPLFNLVDVAYLEDPRVIASHDNMVSINNCLMVDLTGQIASESLGEKMLAHPGGQLPFVIGVTLSKGGRSIMVVPSTAQKGRVSRIVSVFPEGTGVTVPRTLTQFVVSEYGIADLRNKTYSQRANELIAIAAPEFRGELRKTVGKL